MITVSKRSGVIHSIFHYCQKLAIAGDDRVTFEFNGVNFVVDKNTPWNNDVCDIIMDSVQSGSSKLVYL